MTEKQLRQKFASQKCLAKKRGIGWELTFDQWLEWWGKDINRRGNGHDMLQMLRYSEDEPYALGNIYKGTPRENKNAWAHRAIQVRERYMKAEEQRFINAIAGAFYGTAG